ncbi:IBR domain protein [Ceratobasidium sp. AG-Ba]|nr:IBR domain protein [Ceratobasidium sp. AG-Ba]
MIGRVLSPASTLQQTTTIAQIGSVLGASDAIPALGFARAGPGPSIASRSAQPALASRSNTAHGFTPESSRFTHTQNAPPPPPPSNNQPSQAFTAAMRNAEVRYNPMASRHGHPQRASNPGGTLPSNSILASRMDAPSRLGQASRVAFAPDPGPVVQSNSGVPQSYNPPTASRSPRSQPQPGPPSNAPMSASHYTYAAAPSAPKSTMNSLAPPPAPLTSMHQRSPSPLKLSTQQSITPRPATAASTSDNRQAAFIDSPIDYYSRLDSKLPALPPTSAYEQSPQSSVPAGPLFSVQTPDPTPTHNQSFETQQRQLFVHPQRNLPPQRPQTRARVPHDAGQRMCVVCFDKEPSVRFAERSPTGNCVHNASVCTSCLEMHILVEIHHHGNVDVRCPHEGCRKMLDYRDIYASVRDWSRLTYYEALLLKKEAESHNNFVWCKNPQCRSGQIHKAGKYSPIVTCITCGAKSCFTHDRPWHEGLTCEQYDKQRRDEEHSRATDRYLAQNTKECPKCHRKIERNGGCDHMVCKPPGGCGHQFCWECLDYEDHTPSCSHFTGHPVRRPNRRRR